MQDRRYYYTDPIDFIHMSRYFGMTTDVEWWAQRQRTEDVYDCYTFLQAWERELTPLGGPKIYIHPDSEHIFEPQENDLIFWAGGVIPGMATGYPYTETADQETVAAIKSEFAEHGKIIQRNGKAFHWPESEEV